MIGVKFEWGEPHLHTETRQTLTRQGTTIEWTIPSCEVPLLCNGRRVGYAEVHLHPAWAPDGVPDTSFGFTGRINTEELRSALGA